VRRFVAQLSALTTKVDTLQNSVTPETTGSISQMRARNRMLARKKISRLPKPFGPVSVGGAPLSFAPAQGPGVAQNRDG
jgi:hypothetical protein